MTNQNYWEARAKKSQQLSFEFAEDAIAIPELKRDWMSEHPYERVAKAHARDAAQYYKHARRTAPYFSK